MKGYFLRIAKWALIGLLIRLALMPLAMHGQDLFFINYFPMKWVTQGIWDPYGCIKADFPYFPYTYYGPFLFFIMSAVNYIVIKLFNPAFLIRILELSGAMLYRDFATVDYVRAFQGMGLLAGLALMKIPYLLFDFLTGVTLLRVSKPESAAVSSFKLWMLNIVVLHSAYMIGQFDIIPAFFITFALLAAVKKRPYLAILSLTLGGATKVFPYIFILPAALLLGSNWKKRCSLLFASGGVTLLLLLPFYLSSGNAVFGYLTQGRYYTGYARWALMGVFTILYAFISAQATKDSLKPDPEKRLLFYFLTTGFLVYAITPVSFRYFVFITPLLALVLPHNRRFAVFTLFMILALAFLRLPGRELQMGLFAPLDPSYFMGFPSAQEVLGRFINIEAAYKIMARVMALGFFAAAWWVWRIKTESEGRGSWIMTP